MANHTENLGNVLKKRAQLFQVGVNFAFIITQDILAFGLREGVVWAYGDFTAAAGAVYNIGRHGIAGGVAAEFLHYIYPN